MTIEKLRRAFKDGDWNEIENLLRNSNFFDSTQQDANDFLEKAANQLVEHSSNHSDKEFSEEIIDLLQKKFSSFLTLDKVKGQILLSSALLGEKNIFQEICEQKAFDVDVRIGHQKLTALHIAAWRGYSESIKTLIKNGANPNLLDKDGRTAIFEASEINHPDSLSLLIKAGGNVNLTENYLTPLQVACQKGNLKIVKTLIKANADIEAVTPTGSGWTALHQAAKNDREEIFLALIDAGANPLRKTNNGDTALSFFEKKDDLLNLLLEQRCEQYQISRLVEELRGRNDKILQLLDSIKNEEILTPDVEISVSQERQIFTKDSNTQTESLAKVSKGQGTERKKITNIETQTENPPSISVSVRPETQKFGCFAAISNFFKDK